MISTYGVLRTFMFACFTLVNILAICTISSKTCIANALEGANSVLTQNAINVWTIRLPIFTFVYTFTETPVAFKAILTAAVETLIRVDTGSQGFVAVVTALLAFIGKFTRFTSTSEISQFTFTLVST